MAGDPYLARHDGQRVEPLKRPVPGWAVLVTVLAALVVAGMVAVAVSWWWLTGRPPTDVEVDSQKSLQLEQRFAPVLEDFDDVDVTDQGGDSRGAAAIDECYLDSGQVHQPAAARAWSVLVGQAGEETEDLSASSRRVVLAVAEQLRQRGWQGGQRLTEAGWAELTLPGDGYTITATVDVSGGVVSVTADGALDVCA